MKKYIFLTPAIANMGGSEMFTYNKWKYLTKHGWDVDIFYFRKGEKFYLKELEQYKANCIPDLLYGISYIPVITRKKILRRLLANVAEGDEVVVESHLYNLTLWGELIAETTGGKSIVNCMEENISQVSAAEAAFFEYKLKRHEVLNASSVKSLHRYFGSRYKDEYEQYTHSYMRAYCSNVVTRSVKSEHVFDVADFSILSIGRLEKPYVIPTYKEVKKFTEKHPDKRFNLVFIGGDSEGGTVETLTNEFRELNNVTLYFLGYMYPVPSNLISMNDVAIASANSVLVPTDEGVPTIAIGIHDCLPIGIYGRTTQNKFARDNEPETSVVELLEDVLIKRLYPKTMPVQNDEEAQMEAVFGRQVDFLSLSPGDGKAYPVLKLYPLGKVALNRTKWVLHQLNL